MAAESQRIHLIAEWGKHLQVTVAADWRLTG